MSDTKPVILTERNYSAVDLQKLRQQKIWQEKDILALQLGELFEIDHPGLKLQPDFKVKQAEYVKTTLGDKPELRGNWVYFPWSGMLLHTIDQASYFRLRTNRNQLLITPEEQQQMQTFTVGVTGLSVGNGIAVSLVYSGFESLKIAEFDTLETANLNRLRSGIQHLGSPKIDLTLQQIYEISPYASVEAFPSGLKKDSLDAFLTKGKKLGVVFDEIDDFEMKIRLRIAAKAAKIPVIMMTSLGDNILVDIERYDTEPNLPIFNGLLGDLPDEILKTKIGEKEKVKYAMDLVGVDYVPTRALQSLFQINRTLVGRPQLYSTIAVDGGLASYLVKRLATGQPLPSGRQYISFEQIMNFPKSTDKDRDAILQQLREMTK